MPMTVDFRDMRYSRTEGMRCPDQQPEFN